MISENSCVNELQEKEQSLGRVIENLRGEDPEGAEIICRDYLTTSPGCIDHLRMLGHALTKQGRVDEAEEQIRFAISLKSGYAPLHEDLGAALAATGRLEEAVASFEKAIQLDPTRPTAHKKLGQVLAVIGRGQEADEAYESYFERDRSKGEVAKGIELYRTGRYDEAISTLRNCLKEDPNNVNAMRFLAITYGKLDRNASDAEALLRRAVQIAPDFTGASINLGVMLTQSGKHMDAIAVLKDAISHKGDVAEAWACLGSAYAMGGYPDQSAEAFGRAIELAPNVPATQMSRAHALKTLGDQPGALRAYRRAAELKPDLGETYWSMANLKIFKFEEEEVDEMLRQLEGENLSDVADVHFRFALGKAFEDKDDYDNAWHYYHTGNKKQRQLVGYDPVIRELKDQQVIKVFTEEFMREHEGKGHAAPDPIFIVGLPRSGSTLVEQILASHSQVEGTAELAELSQIAHGVGRYSRDNLNFPESIRTLSPRDWRLYGRDYIERTRRHRMTDKPFFTDKMPNNFPLVGFACLALPNARIINARRHPLDSCLGSYKQLFGRGQNFTYNVEELGMYYQEYDAMIKHWHKVLPGRVLDVHYEQTVLDLDSQVRRILEHCGLPFEEQCLRFYETDRAVKTASSEQVRQPIYKGALGKWRKYEEHLGEWQEMLGPIIDELPEAVRNAGS